MEINKLVDISSGMCYELLLKDDIWKAFGFKRRPKRGKYFNFLVNRRRIIAEKFLIEELIALNFTIMVQALYSNFYESKGHLDFFEWKARGTSNEGVIVVGILDRIWQTGTFENLDSFLRLFVESTKRYRVENFEENTQYFGEKFSSLESNIPNSGILMGSIYLFRISEFARNIKHKVSEYKDFFKNNSPEGYLNIIQNEAEGKKMIECSVQILEIPN